ncbi:MAG TPA: energy transducer TonB [Bacteroidales bacterium]|nr:energy transducer TonB [Bacteroidales bacterium]
MTLILVIVFMLSGFAATGQTSTAASTIADQSVVKRYFEQALVYPESALRQGLKGKVTISMEVMPDGQTRDYRIERGIDAAMDAEALRLARHILWKPATILGNPVSSRGTIIIEFNPKAYLKKKRDIPHIVDYQNTESIFEPDPIYSLRQLSEAPKVNLPAGFGTVGAYIAHLMKYPEMAAKNNISGNVMLDFVIETNGIASNISIRESVGGGCDQEAIRILEQLRWTPGKKSGLDVRTRADIEIVFRLNEHQQRSVPNQRNTGL